MYYKRSMKLSFKWKYENDVSLSDTYTDYSFLVNAIGINNSTFFKE